MGPHAPAFAHHSHIMPPLSVTVSLCCWWGEGAILICKIGHHTGTQGQGCQWYRYTQKVCSGPGKRSMDDARPVMIWAPTKQWTANAKALGHTWDVLPGTASTADGHLQYTAAALPYRHHGIVFPCCMLAVSQLCSVHCCTKLAVVYGCWCLPLVPDMCNVQWTAVGPPAATAQT